MDVTVRSQREVWPGSIKRFRLRHGVTLLIPGLSNDTQKFLVEKSSVFY